MLHLLGFQNKFIFQYITYTIKSTIILDHVIFCHYYYLFFLTDFTEINLWQIFSNFENYHK